MSAYTVHEPPNPAIDRIDRAEAMVFLKDGFSWVAFATGPVWLLANRLWLGFAGYAATSAAVVAAASVLDVDIGWIVLAIVGLHAVVGYEAHPLQVAALEQRGWNMVGSVMGASETECERRFFEGWLPTQQPLRKLAETVPAASQPEAPRTARLAFWRR
ncbi:MAG: DUF2628 domain-containing protein [Hyphomicrobiaceae bacterium]|nr:DUF2628 domain-containing protein [Hyphomicrobiaceae bacterium]